MEKKNKTVFDIISDYLKNKGYDGLCQNDDWDSCQCRNDDLLGSCGDTPEQRAFVDCRPAYLHDCNQCSEEECISRGDGCLKTFKQKG